MSRDEQGSGSRRHQDQAEQRDRKRRKVARDREWTGGRARFQTRGDGRSRSDDGSENNHGYFDLK